MQNKKQKKQKTKNKKINQIQYRSAKIGIVAFLAEQLLYKRRCFVFNIESNRAIDKRIHLI